MLEHYKTFHSQAKEHWGTEESLAVNMGTAAVGFNQQKHVELVWKLGWTFWTCFEVSCLTTLNIEHYKWLKGEILKYGIDYCKSYFWSNESISVYSFQRLLKNLSLVNPEILILKNFYRLSRNCILSSGTFFWATRYVATYKKQHTNIISKRSL